MKKDTPQEWLDHFEKTLGNVPEPIRAMIEYAPEYFEGYIRMREYIYQEPPKDQLDLKTTELIYAFLDTVTGNLDGAKNHLRPALEAGLTTGELMQAMMQVVHVCDITTWGKTGYKLMDYAAEFTRGEADA